jgi:Cu/Ag efflux pump CusA
MARLAIIVPISIFVIFLLLFDAFKSLRSSLLIIANIPFSVIGGILALYATGTYLSVSAAIGFIALFGQSALNGVVMGTLSKTLVKQGRRRGRGEERRVCTCAPVLMRAARRARLCCHGALAALAPKLRGARRGRDRRARVRTLLVLYVLPSST